MSRDPSKLRPRKGAKLPIQRALAGEFPKAPMPEAESFRKWPEPGPIPTGRVGMKLVSVDDGCEVNVSLQSDVTVIALVFPSGEEWFVIVDHHNPPADTYRELVDWVNEQFKGHAVFE